jgi:O-antigen/teichoic acid export membrane protein
VGRVESALVVSALNQSPVEPELGPDTRSVPWRLDNTHRSDRRVLARSSLTLIGRGLSKFAILIFLVLAARLLSKKEYGIYSYVLVLASTFGILADPQVSVIAGRDVAAGRSTPAESYWAAIPLVVLAGVAAAVGLLVFGLIDAGPGVKVGVLAIAAGFIIFNRVQGVGLDMLRALGRFGLEATIETAATVLLVVGASVIAALGLGVAAVLTAFLVQSLLVAIVCHLMLRADVGPPRRVTGQGSHLVRSGLKLSVAAAATALATRLPLIVLGSVASAVIVASFSAGIRAADAAYLLGVTAGQALLPNIAALLSTDPRRAARLVRRALGLSLIAGAVLAAVLAPIGSEIMRLVFGNKYASSGPLMSVMVLSLPMMGVFWISWFSLCAYHRERDVLAVALVGAAVSILAGILVIPSGGADGAARVYVGVIVVLAAGTYGMLERQLHRSERRTGQGGR